MDKKFIANSDIRAASVKSNLCLFHNGRGPKQSVCSQAAGGVTGVSSVCRVREHHIL